jgi:hypothetical protein
MAPTPCTGSRFWWADVVIAAAVTDMTRWLGAVMGALVLAAAAGSASVAQQGFTPRDENPEDFPAGAGRDDTFYACTACHNFKLVAAQGMGRRQWEDTIDLMVDKHSMPTLPAKDRETVTNYLATTFPQRAAPNRGWQNPFLKQ